MRPRPVNGLLRQVVWKSEVSALRPEHMREPRPLVHDVATAAKPVLHGDFDAELAPRSVGLVQTAKLPEPFPVHEEHGPDGRHDIDQIALGFWTLFVVAPVLEMQGPVEPGEVRALVQARLPDHLPDEVVALVLAL